MNIIREALAIVALACLIIASTTLAIDSYELEQSGECAQCVLLPYLKPNL